MESPLYVLSRAASLMQQKEAKKKADGEKDTSSDSGFEDNPSSPAKITAHEERRDSWSKEIQNLTSVLNTDSTKKQNMAVDEIRSPVFPATKEKTTASSLSAPVSPTFLKKEATDNFSNSNKSKESNAFGPRQGKKRPASPNETRETVIKVSVPSSAYCKLPAPPLTPVAGHYGFPLLSPYATPSLPIISRPSVITAAGCPNAFKPPSFPCCHCMQPSCHPDTKPVYADQRLHGREMHSVIPIGFESPTVDDHFKKSLGPAYDRISPGGHRYEVRQPNSRLRNLSSPYQDMPKSAMSKRFPCHPEGEERNLNEYFHQMHVLSQRELCDYPTIASVQDRAIRRPERARTFTPERFHAYVRGIEGDIPKPAHLFNPRSLEEPVTVDDHFAKALGKLWFEMQVRNSEHMMRFRSKGLKVANH